MRRRIIGLLCFALLGSALALASDRGADRRDLRNDRIDRHADRRDIAHDRGQLRCDVRNSNYPAARVERRDVRHDRRDLRNDYR